MQNEYPKSHDIQNLIPHLSERDFEKLKRTRNAYIIILRNVYCGSQVNLIYYYYLFIYNLMPVEGQLIRLWLTHYEVKKYAFHCPLPWEC